MTEMQARRVSESGWVVESCPHPASLVRWLADVPGVEEAWAAFDCVAVEGELDLPSVLTRFPLTADSGAVTRHEIPVRYDGPDLGMVAERLGLGVDEVVTLHASGVYTVAAMGFSPGFGYLTGLPAALTGVPRLASPRARVSAGAVAVTESSSAVYPVDSPGGWNWIGNTSLPLVDLGASWFRLSVGDEVVFVPEDQL